MLNPEEAEALKIQPQTKVKVAFAAFVATVALAAPGPETGAQQGLIDECKEENPPQLSTLTSDDYLGVVRWGGVIQPAPEYLDESIISKLMNRQREAQKHNYFVSPQRNERIENHIQQFAEGMVEKANSGDTSYKFVMLDDRGSMDESAEVPEDFEGFGYLVKGKYLDQEDRHWERQESANNIYRRKDGSYYPQPGTSYLYVADRHFISTFDLVPAGFDECAYVPGNALTQGAHVNYYEFIGPGPSPWYEKSDHVQGESYYADSAEMAEDIDNHAIESLKLPPGL